MEKLILVASMFICLVYTLPMNKDQNGNDDNVKQVGDIKFRHFEHAFFFGDNKNLPLSDALRDKRNHWKLPVAYEFDSTIDESRKNSIRASFGEYAKKTCITFKEKDSSDNDYISFTKSDGCWSYVGKSGGKQQVSIGDGCEDLATVSHEIMHALGFFHEQSRPDRDQFIKIDFANVETGNAGNFEKQNKETVTTLNHPYDYKSTMHYDKLAFSKNGKPTIIRLDGKNEQLGLGYQNQIGLSAIDALQLKAMYCGGKQGTTSTSAPSTTSTESTTTPKTTPTPVATDPVSTDASTTVSTTYSGEDTTDSDGIYRDEPINVKDVPAMKREIETAERLIGDIEKALNKQN